jgi:hypothetical protein
MNGLARFGRRPVFLLCGVREQLSYCAYYRLTAKEHVVKYTQLSLAKKIITAGVLLFVGAYMLGLFDPTPRTLAAPNSAPHAKICTDIVELPNGGVRTIVVPCANEPDTNNDDDIVPTQAPTAEPPADPFPAQPTMTPLPPQDYPPNEPTVVVRPPEEPYEGIDCNALRQSLAVAEHHRDSAETIEDFNFWAGIVADIRADLIAYCGG